MSSSLPFSCARAAGRMLNSLPRRLAFAILLAAMLLATAGARAASAYENPFAGDQVYVGRTDMGVDACLSPGDPIRAVGDGVVVGVDRNWFEHQPYIWYQLTGGSDAGRYVYVAEQINHLAKVGSALHAGDVVARYAAKGTCLETGWSAVDGATVAHATTGYTEGQVTVAGVSFARLLMSVGVQGSFELVPTNPRTAHSSAVKKHKKKKKKKKAVKPVPAPAPAPAPAQGGSSPSGSDQTGGGDAGNSNGSTTGDSGYSDPGYGDPGYGDSGYPQPGGY